MTSLSEMKRKNKEAGRYFFDKGQPRVEGVVGNYLITRGMGDGYVVYKYNPENGHIDYVNNPHGEYSTQPHPSKSKAMAYARSLN